MKNAQQEKDSALAVMQVNSLKEVTELTNVAVMGCIKQVNCAVLACDLKRHCYHILKFVQLRQMHCNSHCRHAVYGKSLLVLC